MKVLKFYYFLHEYGIGFGSVSWILADFVKDIKPSGFFKMVCHLTININIQDICKLFAHHFKPSDF
jgi:hypothetical protein